MRLQIASDLHLEFRNGRLPHRGDFVPVRDRDVLVLAGDIGRQRMARYFVERELKISPVIYVPGNHEYYGKQSRGAIDADWRGIAAEYPGLHYLVAERVEIEGVRFWGAPWYSDLWGTTSRETLELVRTGINDFALQWGGSAWTVSRHIEQHRDQTSVLRAQAGCLDVVVTHWPPTRDARHPRYADDSLNPYYVNDKAGLVRAVGAKLWVSGHTHEAYDYKVGETRCVGNPAGYPDERRQSELFHPGRVVEV